MQEITEIQRRSNYGTYGQVSIGLLGGSNVQTILDISRTLDFTDLLAHLHIHR